MENIELSSISNIFKPLCVKLSLLKLKVDVLSCLKSNKPESLKLIKQIADKTSGMTDNLQKLKCKREEQIKLCEDMRVAQVEASHIMYKLNQLEKLINMKILNDNGSDYINGNPIPQEALSTPDFSGSTVSSSFEEFSPVMLDVRPQTYSRSLDLKRIALLVDVAHLTENEFKAIPKYMAGRLALSEINKFIDVVNDALSKKYNILSRPMSSLKSHELNLYRVFKRQQTTQLKGQHFVTEEDMARELGKRVLEKKAYNFLTILRHTKRLMRNVVNGNALYIVDSSPF